MNRTWDETEDEAAALWVAKHLGGLIDATAFNAWLAGAPGRRGRFDALWASCMDPAVTEALDRQDDRQRRPTVRPALRDPVRIGLAGAAAVAAALLLAWFSPTIRFMMTPSQSYATQAGEMRTVTLADGSRVTLSGASRISVTLAGDRREVELARGEAFFSVHHDRSRPFSVVAGQSRATVLGTRFDVALDGERTDLAVEQGLVRFGARNASKNILVRAGGATAFDRGDLEPVRQIAGQPVAAWREGWLEADDIPLSRLVSELQRWTRKPIRIADTSLANKRVAGRFRLTNPMQQLDNLASLHGFQLQDVETEYVLTTR